MDRATSERSNPAVFDDPVTLLAALAGGIAGVVLMVKLGAWRASSNESAPPMESHVRATGYAPRHAPSAAPILTALSVAAFGIGLAVGMADGMVDVLPLIPGVLLLAAALLSLCRRSRDGLEQTAVEDDEPANVAARHRPESGGRR